MKNYVGVDLGGTNVRALLVSEEGEVLGEVKETTEASQGPEYVCNKIIKMIEKLDGHETMEGIGIGVPGPVDTVNGVMVMASNLPGFEGYPIARKLEDYFDKPTFIDNDANVAGLAEAVLGAGKGMPIVEYVTISTGIGGALVVNGQVVSGHRGHAGEIANIVVNPGQPSINGLNGGALENECSGTALVRKGKERMPNESITHAGDVFDLAAVGNEIAINLVDEFTTFMARGLADIAHVVDPYAFVLGGGVMKSKHHFFDALEEKFNSMVFPGMRGHIKLLDTQVEDCGAIGAAMLPKSQLR